MPRARAPGGGGGTKVGQVATYPGEKAVQAALGCVGTPYLWGGCVCHKGLDCSCLCRNAWGTAGYKIPRTTITQYPAMRPVLRKNLAPGDLLFYIGNDGGVGPGHVTMYIGGGKIVQAAHSGTRVAVSNVWWSGFVGARRPYGVPRYSGSGGAVSAAKGPQTVPCLPGGKCPPGYSNVQGITSGGGGRTAGVTGCRCTRNDIARPKGGLNPLGGIWPDWLSVHGIMRASQVVGGFLLIVIALAIIGADVLRGPVGKAAAGVIASKTPAGKAIQLVGARQATKRANAEADFKAEARSASGNGRRSKERPAGVGEIEGIGNRGRPGSRIKR